MVDSGTTTPQQGEAKSYAGTIELVEVKNQKGQTVRVYSIDFILMLRNLGAKILPTKGNALAFNTEGLFFMSQCWLVTISESNNPATFLTNL
jgi:hypothetical protein